MFRNSPQSGFMFAVVAYAASLSWEAEVDRYPNLADYVFYR